MVVHNSGCSIASLYAFLGMVHHLWKYGDYYSTERHEGLEKYLKIYWMTKNVELLDTVFMILRHKRRQISFLHVYHHSTMVVLSDLAYNIFQWPCISVVLSLNSFVHVVLYLYYALSAYSPESPPPWKKQLTQLQIAQFVLLMIFAIFGYLNHSFCVYSLMYGISMLYFFGNFYVRAYVKPAYHKKVN